jgi:hypothetical protein
MIQASGWSWAMATRGALRRRRLSALGIGWLVLLPFKLRGLRNFLPDGGGDLNKGLRHSLGGAPFFLSTKAKSGGSLCLFVELLANGASRMDRIVDLPSPTYSLSLQNTHMPRTHCSPFPAFDWLSIVPGSPPRPTACHGDACVPRPWCWRAGDPLSIVLRECCPVAFKVCVQSQLLAGR